MTKVKYIDAEDFEELKGELHRLSDDFYELRNSCARLGSNLIMAIDQLGMGETVERVATLDFRGSQMSDPVTADFIKYMAKIKLAIEKTMEKK